MVMHKHNAENGFCIILCICFCITIEKIVNFNNEKNAACEQDFMKPNTSRIYGSFTLIYLYCIVTTSV